MIKKKIDALELWRSLVQRLEMVEPNTTQAMAKTLIDWLAEHKADFESVAERYGLNRFWGMRAELYPVGMAQLDPIEEISAFRRVPLDTIGALAMQVGEVIWKSVVWQTSQLCPSCYNDDLRALKVKGTNQIVLACDFCGSAQTLQGQRWNGVEELVIMKTEELTAHGLIDYTRAH